MILEEKKTKFELKVPLDSTNIKANVGYLK